MLCIERNFACKYKRQINLISKCLRKIIVLFLSYLIKSSHNSELSAVYIRVRRNSIQICLRSFYHKHSFSLD